MRAYVRFLWRCLRLSFQGGWRYHLWMLVLSLLALVGLNAWARQVVTGLSSTGLTDHVAWGLYIANFSFLVGIGAAAVMLVVPAYLNRQRKELQPLVILAELFAVAVIVMALCFVVVDLGRPDRLLNLFRRLSFPDSLLAWDVVVLSVYLLLNLHICGYLIYSAYRGREPTRAFYVPFVLVAIGWAVTITVVTTLLYVDVGARPFWSGGGVAPRFVASAFAAGPAFIILTLQVLARYGHYEVPEKAYKVLRTIVMVALFAELVLMSVELAKALQDPSAQNATERYLFFGIDGQAALVPWVWAGFVLCVAGFVLLVVSRKTAKRGLRWLNLACVLLIVGLWLEKTMGLIVPGQLPSPLGEVVEYTPSLNEVLVSLGIWAIGLLLYTIMVRVTVPVLNGQLREDGGTAEASHAAHP